jgi:hypothetical protein
MVDTNIEELLKSQYLKGNYDEAIKKLIISKKDFHPGQFHFLLGTLYVKKGNYAAGRYNLEKSLNEGYINTKVLHNLVTTKAQLAIDDLSTSPYFYDKTINFALDIPSQAYFSLSLVFVFIVLILRRLKFFKRKLILVLVLLISFTPMGIKYFYVDKINYAINLENTTIHEGPSKIFPESGKLKAGTKFVIGERDGDWFLIKNPINIAGWIQKEGIAIY